MEIEKDLIKFLLIEPEEVPDDNNEKDGG